MITYQCDSYAILAVTSKSRVDRHHLISYNIIMQCLNDCKLLVDLQILNIEANKAYKHTISSD